jgi:hypothetical protein
VRRNYHNRCVYITTWVIWSICVCILAGCENNTHNFSQHPGFSEYFMANPPSHGLPAPEDRQMLRRFRPRFMMAEGEAGAIDFYRDYIAHGELLNGDGVVLSTDVTQEILNSFKDSPDVVFRHQPGSDPAEAVVYGRIDRQAVSFDTTNGGVIKPLTFLTYNIVFRNSGVPAGILGWQEALLGLFFNLNDWHQLDHYTAVTLVLEVTGDGGVHHVAVILQQHNNVRTYLIGEGITFPDDGRVVVDIAKRSNELYPHMQDITRHRAVNMPDPEGMRFLLSGERKPILAGYDITEGVIEVEYTLEFLPHDNAFYTFKGFLGERRRLKGRDAPPGADYNTLPQLKPLSIQLFSGYWREDHPGDIERLEKTILTNRDYMGFARLQGAELYRNWKRIQ